MAPRSTRYIIVELRIKLKYMVITLKRLTDIYCYNQVVVKNTSAPKYTLNKNHKSINYHAVHKTLTDGILRVVKEDTDTKFVDTLTKLMPYSQNN